MALYGAYLEASDSLKLESATVPFWEDLLNELVADKTIRVNSQTTAKLRDKGCRCYGQKMES